MFAMLPSLCLLRCRHFLSHIDATHQQTHISALNPAPQAQTRSQKKNEKMPYTVYSVWQGVLKQVTL